MSGTHYAIHLKLHNKRIEKRGDTPEKYKKTASKFMERYPLLAELLDMDSAQVTVAREHANYFIYDMSMLRVQWCVKAPHTCN